MTKMCECGCGEPTKRILYDMASAGRVKGEYSRFLHGHANRRGPVDYIEEDTGYRTPCWVWQRSTSNGYGRKAYRGKTWQAHRVYYTEAHGEIPDGLPLDHLCKVRACVRPDHLEPVTTRENNLRRDMGNPFAFRTILDETVEQIRLAEGSLRTVGRQFGVSHEYVRKVRAGTHRQISWR